MKEDSKRLSSNVVYVPHTVRLESGVRRVLLRKCTLKLGIPFLDLSTKMQRYMEFGQLNVPHVIYMRIE
jgi:hypothetical protein